MKIHLFSILVIALSLTSCNNNSDKTFEYELYGLNSPVKSINVTTYEAEFKFGEITKGDLEYDGHYLAEFNDVGNITKVTTFDDDGELDNISKYKYNENGNLIENAMYYKNGDLLFQINYEYDDKYIIKTKSIQSSYTKEQTKRITNIIRDGKRIIEENIIENDSIISKIKYQRYDDKGCEWIMYNELGDEISKGLREWNKKQQIIKMCINEECIEIVYNDKNLPIYLKNAKPYMNTFFSYPSNNIDNIEYEYDKKGNWIKQLVYEGENEIPYTISERVIIY